LLGISQKLSESPTSRRAFICPQLVFHWCDLRQLASGGRLSNRKVRTQSDSMTASNSGPLFAESALWRLPLSGYVLFE
jgi:hypothetical protein